MGSIGYVDITENFFQASKELALGEIVKAETFNLSDGMSAIELCDQKMDTGMIPINEELDLADIIRLGKINVKKMPIKELLATMDGTFAMTVSWLNSIPLDQSVYTNICLLSQELLEDELLLCFSASIIYFLHALKVFIEMAFVFNEEDFSSLTAHKIEPNEKCLEQLEAVIEMLDSQIIAHKDYNKELTAIRMRFRFLQSFFDLFHYLVPPSSALNNKEFIPNFKKASLAIDRCLLSLKHILKTFTLGLMPPDEDLNDGDFSWLSAFEPDVNRHLCPANFPRELTFVNRLNAFNYFIKTMEKIQKMLKEIPEKIKDVESLTSYLKSFGGEDSDVFSRSIAQLIVMPVDFTICATTPLNDIILNSLNRLDTALSTENIVPLFLEDERIHDCLKDFFGFSVKAFIGIFQMYGHNLARQHCKLIKMSIEDFSILQAEADKIENIFCLEGSAKPPLLSTFLFYPMVELVHYHFELGFQLELFVPFEFSYIYWCFGELVLKSLIRVLERRCNLMFLNYSTCLLFRRIKINLCTSLATSSNDKKMSGKKLQKKQKDEADLFKFIEDLQQKMLIHKAESIISLAIFKFCIGLELSNRLVIPEEEEIRYNNRMGLFSALPSMLYLPYADYRKKSCFEEIKIEGPEKCFIQACQLFEDAYLQLESLDRASSNFVVPNRSALLKLTKQNKVVAALIAKLPQKKVHFEFSKDVKSMFPLIKLL